MTELPRLLIDHVETPVGLLALAADEEGRLCALRWTDRPWIPERAALRGLGDRAAAFTPTSNPGGLTAALREYLAGHFDAIRDLPVVLEGTPFQRSVWAALREIPTGETRSYGEIARRIGRASAVRAVGLANGANPVAIVVPCHRVIGSDGSLTGYGGGLERKRWLLALERCGCKGGQLLLPQALRSGGWRRDSVRSRIARSG
ncbi:MAG TPA: methylated-DNA--[protein]-cysteine S-methyltransferase [Polyangiaceae bacterium]|nr:methylated-DNA--[protein]-cysteine S-methyltransferase [Polyangiaceae bacterium]